MSWWPWSILCDSRGLSRDLTDCESRAPTEVPDEGAFASYQQAPDGMQQICHIMSVKFYVDLVMCFSSTALSYARGNGRHGADSLRVLDREESVSRVLVSDDRRGIRAPKHRRGAMPPKLSMSLCSWLSTIPQACRRAISSTLHSSPRPRSAPHCAPPDSIRPSRPVHPTSSPTPTPSPATTHPPDPAQT